MELVSEVALRKMEPLVAALPEGQEPVVAVVPCRLEAHNLPVVAVVFIADGAVQLPVLLEMVAQDAVRQAAVEAAVATMAVEAELGPLEVVVVDIL